jgi:tetratricopeptide (TPR) repeat protein
MASIRPAAPSGAKKPDVGNLLREGLALHQSGGGAQAASFYERALALDPGHAAANHLLGLVRLGEGRAAEAVDLITRATVANPDDAQYFSNLGVALDRAGRPEEAVTALQKAIALNVEFAEAFSNLGMVLRSLRRYPDAVSAYRRAVQLKPREAGFYLNLANALWDAGHIFEAESAYRRAVHLRPNYSAAINGLATMLGGQGRASETIDLIEDAIKAQPQDAQLHLQRGRALYQLGRLEDALESFDETIKLAPAMGEAHLHRSNLVRRASRDAAVENMSALFKDESAPLNDRIFAGFGLGKALADLDAHPESIEVFLAVNRLHRDRTPFSIDRARQDLAGDLARFSKVAGPDEDGGFRGAMPIFVVGLPRSGKTTTETILGRHPHVAGAGELPTLGRLVNGLLADYPGVPISEIPPDRFTELGRSYMREAQSLVPQGKILVDTMPANFRHVGFIRMALPYARIVHCQRTPGEHCVAIFEKYLTSNGYEYSNDIDELQSYHAAYRDQIRGWQERFPDSIYDLDFSRFTANRRAELRRLLEFCGLSWNDACMAEARSEPQYNDWPRSRIARNREAHMAAWREVRPGL